MPAVTIRLTDEEAEAMKEFAIQERRTMADAVRVVLMERLEDEYDLKALREAEAEFQKNPVTYPLADVMKEHGLHV
jgi:Arc/MetJ family transcription regulator